MAVELRDEAGRVRAYGTEPNELPIHVTVGARTRRRRRTEIAARVANALEESFSWGPHRAWLAGLGCDMAGVLLCEQDGDGGLPRNRLAEGSLQLYGWLPIGDDDPRWQDGRPETVAALAAELAPVVSELIEKALRRWPGTVADLTAVEEELSADPEWIAQVRVPLVAGDGIDDGGDPHGWVDDVERFIEDLDPRLHVTVYDDGEEEGDSYVFYLRALDSDVLLSVAFGIADLETVPDGAVVRIGDVASEWDAAEPIPLERFGA